MTDSVFISYCHKDERWRDDLLTHLKPYLRNGLFSAWSDQQITPGSRWFREIQAAIAATKVAVLLVTPDFLASDFIHEHELAPFLREAERGGVRIIWVPVSPSAYEKTPLKDYQAVINPSRPLASIRSKADRNKAWGRVCKEIEKAVRDQSREPSLAPAIEEQKTQDDVSSGSPRVDTNTESKGRQISKPKKLSSRNPLSQRRAFLSRRPEKAGTGLTPTTAFQTAMKAVPSLKYALGVLLGVLGIVSAFAIIKSFGIGFRAATFGTIIMLVLMVALTVFAALTKVKSPQVRVMMWFSLALTLPIAVLLCTSVYFKYPRPITSILGVEDIPQGKADGQTGPTSETTEDAKPPLSFTSELADRTTISPDGPLLATVHAAEVKRAVALGKIPASEIEFLEGVVPDLAARGPLGELKRAINQIGASLRDIHLHAYACKQPGTRVTPEFLGVPAHHDLENLHGFVSGFALILQRSACVDRLVPPSGQTKDQYVMHLLGLAEEAEAIGRRYVVWESGTAANGTGYGPAAVYLTKDECKIENILAADCRVSRALWDELHYLKRLETTVLARSSSAN